MMTEEIEDRGFVVKRALAEDPAITLSPVIERLGATTSYSAARNLVD